jgi:AcrR family transcriptional regulator
MPRPLAPGLEERILDAAQELWSEGGETALSMRAVAERAGTYTPRIYARFKDKEVLLQALRSRAVNHLRTHLAGARSFRDGLTRYLDFAAEQPFEYRLLFGPGFGQRAAPGERGRLLDILQQRLAARHGGAPADYRNPALALWALLHGTAMLQQEFELTDRRAAFRTACLDACEQLAAGAGGQS